MKLRSSSGATLPGGVNKRRTELSFSSIPITLPTVKSRLIMLITHIVRLGAPCLAFLLIVIMLSSQRMSSESFLPVVEIDTATMNIYSGLYSTLGNTFDSDNDDLGQGLSTSAIALMSNLTSVLMGSLPDRTTSTYTHTCFHTTNHYRYLDDSTSNNDDVELILPFGVSEGNFNFTNVTVECHETTLFDYRDILYGSGFYFMLQLSNTDPESDKDYSVYQTNIDKKNKLINSVPPMLIFVLVSDIVTLCITGYYHHACKKDENSRAVKIMGHLMACWTLLVFIVNAVSTISLTQVFIQIQSMALTDFQTFGVHVYLGVAWFALLWLVLFCSMLTMFGWVGPAWCAPPDNLGSSEENDILLKTRPRADTLESSLRDPFVSPFDAASDRELNVGVLPSAKQEATETAYGSEFGLDSSFTNDESTESSRPPMRPIL